MMMIFITGSTGYLGSAIQTELLASGIDVVAQARSAQQAASLEARGATAATGDLRDRRWLADQLSSADGMIHAASPNDATSEALDTAVIDAVLDAFSGSDRPYVHTAGAWIHGSGPHITEDTPMAPPPMVAWRPAIVARVRDAADRGVRSCVISPANLYGHAGGLPALLAAGPVTDGDEPALMFPGRAQHFGNVFVEDVARLYRLAVLSAPPGSYFLAASASAPTIDQVASAASRLGDLDGRVTPEPETQTRARLGPLAEPPAAGPADRCFTGQEARLAAIWPLAAR